MRVRRAGLGKRARGPEVVGLLSCQGHGEPCVLPRLNSAAEHCGVGESLSLSPSRLTDGRCVSRSASVKHQLNVARQRGLPPLEFAEGNRTVKCGVPELRVTLIGADQQGFPRLQFVADYLGTDSLRCIHVTTPLI